MVQLGGGDGVILVDNGNHSQCEQRDQRGAEVAVASGVAKIVFRQQNLCRVAPELVKGVVIDRHEAALSDGRTSLNLRELSWTAGETNPFHAQSDGAGGNHQYVASLLAQPRHGL